LEFILENPFAIIFIIGIITSIFKKMKANEQDPKHEKQPDWKKMMNFPQTFNEERHEKTSTQLDHPINKSKLAQEYYEVKKTNEKQRKEYVNPIQSRQGPVSKRLDSAKSNAVNSEVESVIDLSPTKEKVIDAVIWSEILGPPRALKPHSTRRETLRR
jgi:hypothetical protein